MLSRVPISVCIFVFFFGGWVSAEEECLDTRPPVLFLKWHNFIILQETWAWWSCWERRRGRSSSSPRPLSSGLPCPPPPPPRPPSSRHPCPPPPTSRLPCFPPPPPPSSPYSSSLTQIKILPTVSTYITHPTPPSQHSRWHHCTHRLTIPRSSMYFVFTI